MMSLTIKNHWVQEAIELSTSKKGPGKLDGPRGIVYHFTSGWTTKGDIATLTTSDRQASVQFIIGRKGREELYQCMPANVRAWHAGPSRYRDLVGCNNSFIGFEMCNIGYLVDMKNGWFKDEYGNVIDGETGKFKGLDRYTETPPALWPKHPHKVVGKEVYSWEPFPAAQLDCVEELTAALVKYYPTIKYGVTHEEIDTRGWKSDPGPVFPMRRMLKVIENRGEDTKTPTGIEYLPAATLRRFIITSNYKSSKLRPKSDYLGAEFVKGEVVFPAATTQVINTGKLTRYWLVYGDSGEGWVSEADIKEITPEADRDPVA